MKKSYRNVLLLAGALAFASVPAQATVEVKITDSLGTNTYVGIPCGANTCVTASQSDADFDINITIASSNSPSGNAAILSYSSQVDSLVASQTLTIEVSDTNFALPSGPATLIQEFDATSPALGLASGSVTSNGYYGTGAGNILFCQETAACSQNAGPVNLPSFVNGEAGTASNGFSFAPPFSLDDVMTATFTSAGHAQWEGNLSAMVPEPASVMLLGGALLVTFGAFRRKLRRG